MSYYLAPSLSALRDELNEKWPKRDKASDGWIGDARHQAESYSDHNPCWSCTGALNGVVRALDIDNNGTPGQATPLVKAVLKACIGDPRVWYVIWDGKIYSRTYGWRALVYTGSDPHTNHVHVSLNGHNLPNQSGSAALAAVEDTSAWLGGSRIVATLPSVRLASAILAAQHPRKAVKPITTRRIQRALAAKLGAAGPAVDGIYGPATRAAYRAWQLHLGIKKADAQGIPKSYSLTRLGADRFRVLKD